jgi:hypothetical protein
MNLRARHVRTSKEIIAYNNTVMFVWYIMICWTNQWIFSRQTFLEYLRFGIDGKLPYCYRFTLKNLFLTKKLKLKIDSAASCGGQEKLTYSRFFPWLPLEAGYQFQRFTSHLNVVGSFSIYTFLIIRGSPRQITRHQTHVSTAFKV